MNGEMVKRNTPLDFAAVTDHAEYMGVAQLLADPNHPLFQKPVAAKFRSKDPKEGREAYLELAGAIAGLRKRDADLNDPKTVGSIWKHIQEFAEQYNAPGKFTTFIAFEWTSTPDNNNLHRNVIFGGTVVPELPLQRDGFDTARRPVGLYRARARCRERRNRDPPQRQHQQRADVPDQGFRWQAIYARVCAAQARHGAAVRRSSSSRARPRLRRRSPPMTNSPTSSFIQFQLGTGKKLPEDRTSFIREAYKSGLSLGATLGVNPFKFGLVGASDSHDGTASPEENNFSGGHGATDKDPTTRLTVKDPLADKTKFSASGLTGVWAEENTRASIFAALKRKETFATSGTFIRARLFGGWNYAANLTESPDWVKKAYAGGVPMGSDLPRKPAGATVPTFVVAATKDPRSGNLDRIQIVKGWLDAKGQAHEKIYDVVLSDGRTVDPATGKAPPVGNTVDVKTASYTNDIGDPQLMTVWSDRDFDPATPAFYYARVLEIPTPRWTTFDAVKLGIPAPEPATLQERAWTSPIWYSP